MFETIKFGILFGLSQGFVFCAYAVAFSIGSYLVHERVTTFPNIFRVLGTVVIGSIITGRMLWDTPNFRRGRIAAKRLLPLIENVPDDSASKEENETLEQCKGAVSFENVTFNDPTQPDVTLLKNFSLSIKSGGTVAVVGAKEAEKKAIIELIERFYKPISGTIKLDNVDLQNQRLDWLRSQLCILKQEALFIDVSIIDNILYGSTSGINEVIEVCKLLRIHEFFSSLPAGYKTKLEEIVLPFHPQRLVIARALVRNSQIVFVDCESLSLNAPGEEEIQEIMFRSLEEKTLIILTNQISLVESANRIVVIDQGRVVESGTHDDLAETDGVYSRLVRSQGNLKERL